MGPDCDTRIDAITFDLDDTLIRYERSPGEVLQVAFERLDLEPIFPVERYYDRYDEFAATCESMDELRSDCFAALAAENGYDSRVGRDVAAAFSDERDQSNVELLPAAERLLDWVSRDHRVAIVTNGAPDAQRKKIDAVNLERWVDAVVIAGRDGPPKPDPEPFDRALRSLHATPATTVHVGDSLEADVAGATAAGLDSVWIADATEMGGFEPTYVVNSLGDLWLLPWRSSP